MMTFNCSEGASTGEQYMAVVQGNSKRKEWTAVVQCSNAGEQYKVAVQGSSEDM